MNSSNRNDLILCITKVGFYMDDLRLFLDTHPECCEAIATFNKYAMAKNELIREYEEKYGPFTYNSVNCDKDDWRWVAYPWPWEGGCD